MKVVKEIKSKLHQFLDFVSVSEIQLMCKLDDEFLICQLSAKEIISETKRKIKAISITMTFCF